MQRMVYIVLHVFGVPWDVPPVISPWNCSKVQALCLLVVFLVYFVIIEVILVCICTSYCKCQCVAR